MKTLTVYQPWASLILAGAKPYEFRKWHPRERGQAYADLIGQRIVIHAAAKPIDRQEVVFLHNLLSWRRPDADIREAAAETCLIASKALPILRAAYLGDLPMSAGIGTAVLGEPRNGLEIADEFGVTRANDSNRDEHANWGWPMLDPEPWPEPIPMRGFQGFWNWPDANTFAGGL